MGKRPDAAQADDLLVTCAIRLNLARLENPAYDRNREVYRFFIGKKFKAIGAAKRMVDLITRNVKTAAYAFDQYFQLAYRAKPSPDCNPIGEKVKEGMEVLYGDPTTF